MLLAIWLLVACGGSTEPAIETSADAGLSSPKSPEEESNDPPSSATPSTAALEPGQVGERLCGPGAECASEFVLNGTIYALSCEAIREDAVLPEALGSGRAFSHDVVVHAVQGFEPDDVVAISVPGGYCSETDPDEVHTPWSMAFASQGNSATAGRAACQIGALSPVRAEANGCPGSAGWGGAIGILTASADAHAGMEALNTFTLRYDPNLNCLYHDEPDNNGEPGTGGRVAIMWPFGFTAVADEDGVVVFDEAGTPVARTGYAFQIGGGGLPADSDHCQAIGVWVANGSPITPLPEIESLSVEYEDCLQELGFEPGGVQVLVGEDDAPWWVKTGNDVPVELHGPCFEQIGGDSNGLSSHGTDPTE